MRAPCSSMEGDYDLSFQKYSHSSLFGGLNGPSGNTPQGIPQQQADPQLSTKQETVDVAGLFANPEAAAFLPALDDQSATDALGLTLVRAMIAAARSDRRLDAQESQVAVQ